MDSLTVSAFLRASPESAAAETGAALNLIASAAPTSAEERTLRLFTGSAVMVVVCVCGGTGGLLVMYSVCIGDQRPTYLPAEKRRI